MNLTLNVIIILQFTSKLVSNYELEREEVTQISTPGLSKFQNDIQEKASDADLNKITQERNNTFGHKYQRWKKAPMFKCIQENMKQHILPKTKSCLPKTKSASTLQKIEKQVKEIKLAKCNNYRSSLFDHDKPNWLSEVSNNGNRITEWKPTTESFVNFRATNRLVVDVLNAVDLSEGTSRYPPVKPTNFPCCPVKHRVTAAVGMMITSSYDEEAECRVASFPKSDSAHIINDVVVINTPCKLRGCPDIVMNDKSNESLNLTFRKNMNTISHRPSAKFRNVKAKIAFEDTEPNLKPNILEELLRNRYYLSSEQFKNKPDMYFCPKDRVAEKLERLEKTGFIAKWKPETLLNNYQQKLKAFYVEEPASCYSVKLKPTMTRRPSNNRVVKVKNYSTTSIPSVSKTAPCKNVNMLMQAPPNSKSHFDTSKKILLPVGKSHLRGKSEIKPSTNPYYIDRNKDLTDKQSEINKQLIENLIKLMKKKIITRELGNHFNLNKL